MSKSERSDVERQLSINAAGLVGKLEAAGVEFTDGDQPEVLRHRPNGRRIQRPRYAARAILRCTVLDLAGASKVGVATIRRVEMVNGEIPATAANEAAIRRTLVSDGIDFIDEPHSAARWSHMGKVH